MNSALVSDISVENIQDYEMQLKRLYSDINVEERKNKEALLKNQIEINNELSKNNENLKLEKEKLNSQIEQYKEMYEAIINSRSWKITKPIRDMADKMKRVKKK